MKVFMSLLSLLVLGYTEQAQIEQLLGRVMQNPFILSIAIVFLVFFVGVFGSKYTETIQKTLILLGFSALLFLSYWNQVNKTLVDFEQNKQKNTLDRVGKIDKIRGKIENLKPKIKCFLPQKKELIGTFWACKQEQKKELAQIEKDKIYYESRISEIQKEIIDITEVEPNYEEIIVKACIGVLISIIFTGVFRVSCSIIYEWIDSWEVTKNEVRKEIDYFDSLSLERKIQILKQEGKDPKEISESLEIPLSTVYYKLKRMA